MKYRFEDIIRGVEAAFFDMDGTLIDSMWVWSEIDVIYLGKHGYEVPEGMQKEIEGMSFSETAAYFKKRFNITDDLETIKQEWNDMAYHKYLNEVPLKKGVYDFLKELKASRIKLGICTSNSRLLVDSVTKALGIDDLFDIVVTSCEVGVGKPAPYIYLAAAKQVDVRPENCIVFEDVPMGIMAGKNAGMKACAVEDDFSKMMKNEKVSLADYFIDDYDDIIRGRVNI